MTTMTMERAGGRRSAADDRYGDRSRVSRYRAPRVAEAGQTDISGQWALAYGISGLAFEFAWRRENADMRRSDARFDLTTVSERMTHVTGPGRCEAYRAALSRALAILCSQGNDGRPTSLAAYRAWLEVLADGSVSGADGLSDPDAQYAAARSLAECRGYAASFLRQAAEACAGVRDELLRAAECYEAVRDLMEYSRQVVDALVERKVAADAVPSYRRELVRAVALARKKEAEVICCLRQAMVRDQVRPN